MSTFTWLVGEARAGTPGLARLVQPYRATSAAFDQACRNLPVELVYVIAHATAEYLALRHKRWVASLLLVCKAFRDIIMPVLIETVCINLRSLRWLQGDQPQLQQTARLIVDTQVKRINLAPSSLRNVVFFSGRMAALRVFSETIRPIYVTLRDTRDSGLRWEEMRTLTMCRVTHLHLELNPLPGTSSADFCDNLPPQLSHFAFDALLPITTPVSEVTEFVLAVLVKRPKTFSRLLIRTTWLNVARADELLRALIELAEARAEPSIYVDDRVKNASIFDAPVADEEARGSLWYAGRQLFRPGRQGELLAELGPPLVPPPSRDPFDSDSDASDSQDSDQDGYGYEGYDSGDALDDCDWNDYDI